MLTPPSSRAISSPMTIRLLALALALALAPSCGDDDSATSLLPDSTTTGTTGDETNDSLPPTTGPDPEDLDRLCGDAAYECFMEPGLCDDCLYYCGEGDYEAYYACEAGCNSADKCYCTRLYCEAMAGDDVVSVQAACSACLDRCADNDVNLKICQGVLNI